jgi:hypothetical protein
VLANSWIVKASFFLAVATLIQDAPFEGTLADWLNNPAIEYRRRPVTDPVNELNQRIAAGGVTLKAQGPTGYLRALLDALKIPLSSQIALFVPDSVQGKRINPANPRTLFFNDSVVVGWVGGGFIEIASQDPQQGVIFYTLDANTPSKPLIRRDDGCLSCHFTHAAVGVPGMLVRSSGQYTVDDRLPLEQRWGGWYVTGQHGSLQHLGNLDTDKLYKTQPSRETQNWKSLDGKLDANLYLSSHSDIAALMVFGHQMRMMNLLTRINWEARVSDKDKSTAVSLKDGARELVDYLLFVDEAVIKDKITGSTSFAAEFAEQGPKDKKGRSLRQLDLTKRLMRYPCSYMIYSKQFDGLPIAAKDAVYRRMWEILSGQERDKKYSRLALVDRSAIVEILRDTKPDLPGYFKAESVK